MKHLIMALALLIPTPPQAIETASAKSYKEEVYVTGFGLVCIILTRRDTGSPVGLSCDWDRVLANKGKMLRPSREILEPTTEESK